MGNAKYILKTDDVPNPLKGKNGKGDAISVYDDADLRRRLAAAEAAGVKVNVTRL
jgi:hypothetical protein